MPEITRGRLYMLRAAYLFIAVGLGFLVWPKLFVHSNEWAIKYGDTFGLLAGVQVMALLGIRYPVKMIPLLLFELTWKAIWLVSIALPLWRSGHMDDSTAESVAACVLGVVVSVAAIPWPYFVATYIKAPADRWR